MKVNCTTISLDHSNVVLRNLIKVIFNPSVDTPGDRCEETTPRDLKIRLDSPAPIITTFIEHKTIIPTYDFAHCTGTVR